MTATDEIIIDMPPLTSAARINLPQGRALQLGPSAGDIALVVQQVARTAVAKAWGQAAHHWQAVLAEREQHLDAYWRSVLEDMLRQLVRELVKQFTGRSCIVNFFCDGTAKVTTQRGGAEERRA